MPKRRDEIKAVEIAEEFRACLECRYERGFHVSFKRKSGARRLLLILICPNCGARYDISKSI